MSVLIDQQPNQVIEVEGDPQTIIIQSQEAIAGGLPLGGLTNQALVKLSNTSLDVGWDYLVLQYPNFAGFPVTGKANHLYVDEATQSVYAWNGAAYISLGSVPDATTTVKGKLKLAGDLSGTADLPTVPGLANKADKTTTISTTAPLSGGGDLSANRTLSISQASALADGYLASSDFVAFSGKDLYSGTSPTTVTVGGISAGTAISGQTITQILQTMLVPYINPAFSSFTMSGQATTVEVGTTISGSKSFAFGLSTPGNVSANTLAILDVTGGTTLASGLPVTSPQSATLVSATLNAPGSYSWRGRATNTQSVQFFSSNFTVTWQWRVYAGTSTNVTLTAGQIQALASNALQAGFGATYSLAAGGYKYFAWPNSMGSPTASTGFRDTATNLAVAMAEVTDDPAYSNVQNGWSYALVSVTNGNGVTTNYRVYRTKNILSGSINIQVS